jgi:hypothetical protein
MSFFGAFGLVFVVLFALTINASSPSITATFLGLPLGRGVLTVVVDACLVHLIRHCRPIPALRSMEEVVLSCYSHMKMRFVQSQESRFRSLNKGVTARCEQSRVTTFGHLYIT